MTPDTALSPLGGDRWRMRLICARCEAAIAHDAARVWVDVTHAALSFDDALLVAPSPVCPACGAIDAYKFSRADTDQLTAIIHAAVREQGDAPLPFILVHGPISLAGDPPVTIRRASHGVAELTRRAALLDDAASWFKLGVLAAGYLDDATALRAFEAAIERDPTHPRAHAERVACLRRAGASAALADALPGALLALSDPRMEARHRPAYGAMLSDLIRDHAPRDLALSITLGPPNPLEDAINISDLRDWSLLPQLLSSPSLRSAALVPARNTPSRLLDALLHPVAPANTTVVHAGPRAGRNDPCPCGSGKKYKKCHGAEN